MELPGPFRLARRASYQSDYRIKMGAALVIGKSVITGYNKTKSHRIYGFSIHAEEACIIASKRYDVVGSSIYIYREKNGLPAMARPCSKCMRVLEEMGIKNIFYTVELKPYYKHERLN